jgi:uncharacterized phage-associated protein
MSLEFNYKKATQALNYFARKKGGSIDTLMAIKLVWLADRLHLRKYGRFITNDKYFAMKLGPVGSGTYNIIKDSSDFLNREILNYSSKFITCLDTDKKKFISSNEIDEKVFSKSELSVLDHVFSNFSNMTKWQLSDYSHLFDEWSRYKDQIGNNSEARFEIIVDDFFNITPFGDEIFDQSQEVLECVKELYNEQNP